MKITVIQRWFTCSVLILTGLMLLGFTYKKQNWGNEKTGFTLQYQLAKGQKLNYVVTSKAHEVMEVTGKKQVMDHDNFMAFTLVGGTMDDSNKLASQITVDKMSMKMSQISGEEKEELDRDLSNVVGKSFSFTFTPQGKEIDLAGIEKLTIDMGPTAGGVRDIREHFLGLLPDLSDKPVKIGETWTSRDETNLPLGSYSVKTIADTTSKIEGYEKIDGYECLKIHSDAKGTMDGSGTMMKLPFTLKGDVTDEGTWYFAYKKGILIKTLSNVAMKIMINVGGDQGINIPMTLNVASEVKLGKPTSTR